jgi:hypothetical protein
MDQITFTCGCRFFARDVVGFVPCCRCVDDQWEHDIQRTEQTSVCRRRSPSVGCHAVGNPRDEGLTQKSDREGTSKHMWIDTLNEMEFKMLHR